MKEEREEGWDEERKGGERGEAEGEGRQKV